MVTVLRSAFQKNSSSHSRVKFFSPTHVMESGSVSSTWCSAAQPVYSNGNSPKTAKKRKKGATKAYGLQRRSHR